MISVSDGWKNTQYRFLLPETYVEISVGLMDSDVHDLITTTATNESPLSNTQNVIENPLTNYTPKYATLEHNLWALDGSRSIAPGSGPYNTPGYVSLDMADSSVTLQLSEVRQKRIPGFTITWSSEFDEYPTSFAVIVRRGDVTVASTYVSNNNSTTTQVNLDVSDYDSVTVEVYTWCLPNHRARIDLISLGHVLTYTKKDIISYTHEQYGGLNSSEISRNGIEFTLDNSDGKWNPNNTSGMAKFLNDRQVVTVRYGMEVDGATEWINAGTFYMHNWRAPANGLEATFAARDIFEYLLNQPYTGVKTGTLGTLIRAALETSDVPSDFHAELDSSLEEYTTTVSGDYTAAEVIQMCANAGCCVMYQDRWNVLHIEPLDETMTDYTITTALSYSHPEITLTKPMRDISVAYGEEDRNVLVVGDKGESQTVDNPLILDQVQAANVAGWVWKMLRSRKTVSGEYRSDPRLDLFDMVTVESKYGQITPVAITDIRYTYSGSFKATYSGTVISDVSSELGTFILGLSKLSEGI